MGGSPTLEARFKMINYTRTKINNIDTVIYPFNDVFAIKIELTIKAGSYYEPGKNWGAFHLLEHLVHQGTKKLPTNLDIELFKEKHGLLSNAYTAGDHLKFWVKTPHYSLKPALELLNQIVFQPIISKERLGKEISVITQEYKDKWNSPFTRFNHSLQKQIYGQYHPYTRDGIGQPKYLLELEQKDLQKLHQEFFTANNAQLVITGRLSAKNTIGSVRQILKPASGKTISLKTPSAEPNNKKVIHREDVKQDQIVITWPLPGYNKLSLKQRLEIGIFSYILGGNSRSILSQEIRQKQGLAYRIWSSFGWLSQAGYFNIRVSSEPKNRQKIIKLLKNLTYELANHPIDRARLSRANAYLSAGTIMNFDSIDNVAHSLSNNLLKYGKIYLPQDYIKTAKTITSNSIIQTLKKHITPKNELIAILTKNKQA